MMTLSLYEMGRPVTLSNDCQEYLRTTARFVNKFQWTPKSPDCNPLEYYFWSKLSAMVYEEKTPFQNLAELRSGIRKVSKKAFNEAELQKAINQFKPRLKAVAKKQGEPINTLFS